MERSHSHPQQELNTRAHMVLPFSRSHRAHTLTPAPWDHLQALASGSAFGLMS